jgi:single-strand DNA-binding protein
VAWGKTAEVIAKYCNKGDLIGVTGQLQRREWEKDGQKRYAHEIKVNRIDFCGGGKKSGAPAADDEGFVPVTEEDGELPF